MKKWENREKYVEHNKKKQYVQNIGAQNPLEPIF
jgi:hypothetical protein